VAHLEAGRTGLFEPAKLGRAEVCKRSPQNGETIMPDVFDILRADHREVQQMLAELEKGPTQANRATPLRPEARKQLTEKLVIESSRHEVAEEEYFWPIPAAREHIGYEEDVVWPMLREALTAAEAEDLGKDIAVAKEIAPTRPHPRIPPQPGVLKTAGPAVAAADKVRDELADRGGGSRPR
jgi:hypothetical protein